jgi:hypothetical protein
MMDNYNREIKRGVSLVYLWDVGVRRWLYRGKRANPNLELMAQLFCTLAKNILERSPNTHAEAVLRSAVQGFGLERGRRIAQVVQEKGKPLSLKNFLIYSDLDSSGFKTKVKIENNDLTVLIKVCPFMTAAKEWGLQEFATYYCRYIDSAIIQGYNPEILISVETRSDSQNDFCALRYKVKQNIDHL